MAKPGLPEYSTAQFLHESKIQDLKCFCSLLRTTLTVM